MVLDDEDPYARRQQKDAEIKERSDLDADRYELATGDAAEQARLLARKDSLSPQPSDSRHDIRIHETIMRERRGRAKIKAGGGDPRSRSRRPRCLT